MSVTSTELDRFTAGRAFALFDSEEDVVTTVSGSLGFVDISGFTALTERLAALGKVGAEELTEVLGRVFSEMIDLASRRGGTLLKFGGDALLLLYESDDHALQAASAAVEMRAALRKAVEIPTSVGKLALRMSQGVHSGEIQLIRSRGVHTELVVAGPAASHVTDMEGSAAASEIVVSDATRSLLPPDAATGRKGAGWLLRWRTPRTAPCGFIGMDSGMGGDANLVPKALREHLASGTTEPEHRQATVAFVEVVGIDDEILERGLLPVSEDLSALIASIGSIADEEGVTFLATDVDKNACKVILVAGVPVTQIDEESRMLRAVRRIADFGSPFGVKIGVNRGHVFSGEVGSSHRATYTVMGDTVNLAARIMGAAPAGSVYVSPGVVDRSGTLYEMADVGPFEVKGKAAPVRAYSMGDEIGARTRRASEESEFVGRDDELERLRTLVQVAAGGEGGALVISGPTGIGKTRLVDELVDHVDAPVIEVRAEPYGSANPYRPFRDPLRKLLGIERGSNSTMAAALIDSLANAVPDIVPFAPLIADVARIDMPATAETAPIEGRFRQERTADMVIGLLGSTFPDSMLLVAEDMHWADAASEALLARIARECSQEPWLAVVTGRDYSMPDIDLLELGPLADDAVTQLVHAETEAAPLRPDVVDAIVDRAGGSPLFAQELLYAMRETGDISSLPTSLDGVVGSQIDALPALPRRVLRYVSVLGRSFRTTVARDLIATQGIQLDSATRDTLGAFLDDDGPDRLQFRHALVRDVAYEGLPFRRRKDLHLRAGRLILDLANDDVEPFADILALHFFLGGDAELAWRFCTMAGDQNSRMYGNVEAATQYERAITASRGLNAVDVLDVRDVWLRLGDVLERSGKFDDSLAAYRGASALTLNDPERAAEVLLKRARAKERAGRFSAALAETTRAKRKASLIEGLSGRRVLASSLALAAVIRQAQQSPREALRVAMEAEVAATACGDEVSLARTWRVMDYAHVMLGELHLAVKSLGSLEIYRRRGMLGDEAAVAANLGAYAYWRGDWKAALELYREGLSTLESLGNSVDAAEVSANIGEVLVNQGRFDEAEQPLLAARRTYSATRFGEGLAFVNVLIGRMLGQRGDLDGSQDSLREALAAARELGLDEYILEASIRIADAECRSGSPERGLQILEESIGEAPPDYRNYFAPLIFRVKGSILKQVHRPDDAVAAFYAGLAAAREQGDAFEASILSLYLQNADAADAAADRHGPDVALETLRTLGVRSVPSIDLTIEP